MGYTTINLGLSLTIPTSGTRNWGQQVLNGTWNKISEHDHTGGGKGIQLSTAAISNGSITTAKLADNIGSTVVPVKTPVGTTETIDFDDGMIHFLDLGSASGNVGLTLSNPEVGAVYRIFIIQAAAPKNVTWPVGVKWPQAQAPLLSQTNDAVDSVTLVHVGGGVYYGEWQLDYA